MEQLKRPPAMTSYQAKRLEAATPKTDTAARAYANCFALKAATAAFVELHQVHQVEVSPHEK
ncbi:MAG: hypothetical protein JWO35_427 [Candidatus Saccharibacteria bacterium]|nr:hypothetical protein [Candidatus Saccharibacteria bacterium]